MNLDMILEVYTPEVEEFKDTGELSNKLFDVLYEHWLHEMPYGTAKARDGDPGEWIAERLASELRR